MLFFNLPEARRLPAKETSMTLLEKQLDCFIELLNEVTKRCPEIIAGV